MHFKWLSFFVFLFLHTTLIAQTNAFENKEVALYLSKKNFTFSKTLTLPLSAFANDSSLAEQLEGLKTKVLVKLGETLPEQWTAFSWAKRIYFLNANPGQVTYFFEHYDHENQTLHPAPGLGDRILIIQNMHLSYQKRPTMYAYSNKLISERKYDLNITISAGLYNAKTGVQLKEIEIKYFEWESSKTPSLFNFSQSHTKMETFFSKAFSKLALALGQ